MKDKISKRLINYILILTFLILLIFFLRYSTLISFIKKIFIALIPFYIGFFLSWLLTPIAEFLNSKLKINRGLSNFFSLIFSILVLLVFLFGVLPLALIQASNLLSAFPQIWNSFIEKLPQNIIAWETLEKLFAFFNLTTGDIFSYLKDYFLVITNGIAFVIEQVYSIIVFITQIILGYIIAFYFMGSIRGFVKGLINLIHIGDKNKNRTLVLQMSKTLFSYIRGVFIVSSVVAFLMTIGSYIIGIEGPLVFGLISGITNIIPYLGPILGGIPLVIVALSLGYKQAILAIILIFVVQFVESNFLQPKIMSQATNLHPVTIIIGLLIFGSLFGFLGIIIATPTLSILNVWLKQSKYKDKISI